MTADHGRRCGARANADAAGPGELRRTWRGSRSEERSAVLRPAVSHSGRFLALEVGMAVAVRRREPSPRNRGHTFCKSEIDRPWTCRMMGTTEAPLPVAAHQRERAADPRRSVTRPLRDRSKWR